MPGFILRPLVALQLSLTAPRRTRGAGMLEYALLASLAIALLFVLRGPLKTLFGNLMTSIGGAVKTDGS